jgi:hypothetical protein
MAVPLDGYVRVSKVGGREGEGFISPEDQERAIREWATNAGVEVVMQPHEVDVSGGTLTGQSSTGSWIASAAVSPAA